MRRDEFLAVHVGVRSTFLRNSYEEWLRSALWFALIAGLASIIAAGLLANLALRPIEQISSRLERLTVAPEMGLGPGDPAQLSRRQVTSLRQRRPSAMSRRQAKAWLGAISNVNRKT